MPTSPKLRLDTFPNDNKFWRVECFGTLRRNPAIPTEPFVMATLRPFRSPDFQVLYHHPHPAIDYSQKHVARVGVGWLKKVHLGSVWRKQGRVVSPSYEFIDRLVSFGDSDTTLLTGGALNPGSSKDDYVIPKYVLNFETGDNMRAKWVAVRENGDPFGLIFPALEIFRVFYASSAYVVRTLLEAPLDIVLTKLINPDWLRLDGDTLFIRLRKYLRDAEVWPVAAMLGTEFGRQRTGQIYHSLFDRKGALACKPPFAGPVQMKLYGRSFESGGRQRFLVYWIDGSDLPPPAPHIEWSTDRDNRQAAHDEGELEPFRTTRQVLADDRRTLELVEHEEPNIDESTLYDEESKTRWLNRPKVRITRAPKDSQHSFSVTFRTKAAKQHLTGSTGAGTSGRTESAPVTITNSSSERVEKSSFSARDFMRLLEALEQDHGYSCEVIAVNDDTVDEPPRWLFPYKVRGSRRAWCRINGRPRELLVARVNKGSFSCYLYEVEPKPNNNSSLLLVWSRNGADLEPDVLEEVMENIAFFRGNGWIGKTLAEVIQARGFPHGKARAHDPAKFAGDIAAYMSELVRAGHPHV